MNVDRVVVVKAQDDMEMDNDPVEVNNDLQDHMEIHNNPMEVDRICMQYATNDVHMRAFNFCIVSA
jgi:hypothetical protein